MGAGRCRGVEERGGPRAAVSLLLAIAVVAVAAGPATAEDLEAAPGPDSRVVVHVHKRGLFSGFAHDHHFEVGAWRASARVPGQDDLRDTTVTVVLEAGSLHDRQERLSEADRRKVDAQAAGPEVLDAEHHPRIEFRAGHLELGPGDGGADHLRGVLHGTLALRGTSAPADVTVEADRVPAGWRIRGHAKVRQSAFGIRPFSGFGGTVGVKDEVEIELVLALQARTR